MVMAADAERPQRRRVRALGRDRLGGVPEVGRGPSRSSAWSTGLIVDRLSGRPRRPRAGDRPVSAVPRAADTRVRPDRARRARVGDLAQRALQQLYHPFTSYVIVPLFALANAGIVISGHFLALAYTSPITLGIVIALRGRQAGGHHGRHVARDPAEPRPDPAAGRLGLRDRRRRDRRDRVHGLDPDRDARLPRRTSSRRPSSVC